MTFKKTTIFIAIAAILASSPAYSMLGNAASQDENPEQEIYQEATNPSSLSERDRIARDRQKAESQRLTDERSERDRIREERQKAEVQQLAQEKAKIENIANERERVAAQREAAEKRKEQVKIDSERKEEARLAQKAASKAKAEKKSQIDAYAKEAIRIMARMNDPDNFGDLRSIYGKMWKLDSKSIATRSIMHEAAETLVNSGGRTLTRIADAYNKSSGAQKAHYAKQVPEFATLADKFLKESHFYLKESPAQNRLKNRIAEFRASHNVQQVAETETTGRGEQLRATAGKVGTVAVDTTKKVFSEVSGLGGKVADRFKSACWFNCEKE